MKNKGQSTLEYAIIIAVIIAGLLAMNHYMRRGIEGKLRESTDRIGKPYDAGHVTSKYTTTQAGTHSTREGFGLGSDFSTFEKGVSRSQVLSPAVVNRYTSADEILERNLNQENLFEP